LWRKASKPSELLCRTRNPRPDFRSTTRALLHQRQERPKISRRHLTEISSPPRGSNGNRSFVHTETILTTLPDLNHRLPKHGAFCCFPRHNESRSCEGSQKKKPRLLKRSGPISCSHYLTFKGWPLTSAQVSTRFNGESIELAT